MKHFKYEMFNLSAHTITYPHDFQEVERAMSILTEVNHTKSFSHHTRATLAITLVGCKDPRAWFEGFTVQASGEIADYLKHSGLPTFSSNYVIDGKTLDHPTVVFHSTYE